MLELKNIVKDYTSKNQPVVHALKGINVSFRKNEFVAILGHSGCGKTTLLNIIGGLDRYTSGDLIIEGRSTKEYKDRDWDTYRNHSIGFVFQSYNLIEHISILANVELALSISGHSKKERTKKALAALKKVGLEGLERKKPNQLSGGQMQRVAIARALVNNPEILLADEPTGALDSETSIQVMDLLSEVAKDRLVIMVTHNPDLANQYANRIIKIKDGELISDSNPYIDNEVYDKKVKDKGRKKKTSMSFFTALGLSFTNMMTKKGRTFLTAFAGSIGIIGIALILSVSYGFNNYIKKVQTDALTSYPMSVSKTSVDLLNVVNNYLNSQKRSGEKYPSSEEITSNNMISSLLSTFTNASTQNDTKAFKTYLSTDAVHEKYDEYLTSVQYSYNISINTYLENDDGSLTKAYPYSLYHEPSSTLSTTNQFAYASIENNVISYLSNLISPTMLPTFSELIPSIKSEETTSYSSVLIEQYDMVYGEWPEDKFDVVLIVDEYNQIDDYLLFGLGLKSPKLMVQQMMIAMIKNYGMNVPEITTYLEESIDKLQNEDKYHPFNKSYEEMCKLKYYLPLSYGLYENTGTSDKPLFNEKDVKSVSDLESSVQALNIVGVVRPKKNVTSSSLNGVIGYLPELSEYLVKNTNAYVLDDDNNVISSTYPEKYNSKDSNVLLAELYQYVNPTGDKLSDYYDVTTGKTGNKNTIEASLKTLGYADYNDPTAIYLYPKDFKAKAKIQEMVDEYNLANKNKILEEEYKVYQEEGGTESYDYWVNAIASNDSVINSKISAHRISVSDTVGVLMDSVQIIVDSVSYVLIAFVSISLVVSSIMIGIITYVSVLERTKEIGLLRCVGARKLDVANVFNAETLIIGLSAGLLGVGIALILDIPLTFIISTLAEISLTAIVPWYGIIILPLISVMLTIISGLIPSSIASKKDPVVALRSE